MAVDPLSTLEDQLKEALTPEAWEIVSTFDDVHVSSLFGGQKVCGTCSALLHEAEAHIRWHRRLSLAIRAQGLLISRMLEALGETE